MLEKISFKGFDVEGSSLFIKDEDDSDGGKFNITFTGQKITPQLDGDGNFLFIEVTPIMVGYPHGQTADKNQDTLFRVEAKLTLTFECFIDEKINNEKYKKHSWFFENYIYLCTKLVFEKILKDTILETITLPWSSVNQRK